ncbi:hypothetical protein McanCB21832_002736 [Microsporum canis]
MSEVSSTRLYLGNLPRNVNKQDIEEHFGSHGTGKITEIKLMQGFGFIEYEDAMDAKDVVPGEDTSVDLKDFARQSGLDVVYSETRDRDGKGFVEFENGNDLRTAVEKLDGTDFKGSRVTCTADIQPPMEDRVPKDPYRSRSPRRGPPYPPAEDYDRRGPPRGYSPRGHYRERSPHGGRDYYDRDGYGRRSPPRARVDDYPPPRRPYDDPYEMRSGGPPRHYDDPYMPRGAPFGGRPRSPPRGDYGGYERRGGYW